MKSSQNNTCASYNLLQMMQATAFLEYGCVGRGVSFSLQVWSVFIPSLSVHYLPILACVSLFLSDMLHLINVKNLTHPCGLSVQITTHAKNKKNGI